LQQCPQKKSETVRFRSFRRGFDASLEFENFFASSNNVLYVFLEQALLHHLHKVCFLK